MKHDRFKQILCGMLAALTVISAAACSTEENNSTDDTASAITTSAETTPETSYLDTLPKENFNGYEFRIIAQSYSERPNLPEDGENGDLLNDALYRRNALVEETYGIDIVNIALENRVELKNTVAQAANAMEDSYDLVITSMADGINTLMTGGYLYDLASMPHLSLDAEWWSPMIYEDIYYNDHLYFTSGALSPFFYYTPYVVAYNMKVGSDLGITDIGQMVLDGKWTFDKLIELTADVTRDLNGDSQLDESDMWGMSYAPENIAVPLLTGFGNKMTTRDGSGNFILNMDTEQAVSYIQRIGALLSQEDFSYKDLEFKGKDLVLFQADQILFEFTAINNIIAGYQGIPSFRNMASDYSILPFPKYDENQDNYYSLANPWGPSGIAVPITCADPERNSLIMEAMAYLSWRDVRPVIYDTIIKEKIARDPSSVEILDIIYRNNRYDLNVIFDFGGSKSLIEEIAVGKFETYISRYEKIRSKTEAALQNFVEQLDKIG